MNSDFSFQDDFFPEDNTVKRFEDMIRSKKDLFFDVDEFEDLCFGSLSLNSLLNCCHIRHIIKSKNPHKENKTRNEFH